MGFKPNRALEIAFWQMSFTLPAGGLCRYQGTSSKLKEECTVTAWMCSVRKIPVCPCFAFSYQKKHEHESLFAL